MAHTPAVAYVKFDKASSAALAMEALNGAVLNNGRGPKLKVLLAEEPTQRCGGGVRARRGEAALGGGGLGGVCFGGGPPRARFRRRGVCGRGPASLGRPCLRLTGCWRCHVGRMESRGEGVAAAAVRAPSSGVCAWMAAGDGWG